MGTFEAVKCAVHGCSNYWGYVPDEYKEGSTHGTDNEESV